MLEHFAGGRPRKEFAVSFYVPVKFLERSFKMEHKLEPGRKVDLASRNQAWARPKVGCRLVSELSR
ncbi:hypothetical protein FCM35_KLT17285 [Carex littledalei]|uniref:Uncharacterized protein n=1 Tax=Carex littledalei TaxID=544730 RepID=A0A833REM4_9POAL|nr:hypothetical protein FCM35_KLT17285 [Carex littledalei]